MISIVGDQILTPEGPRRGTVVISDGIITSIGEPAAPTEAGVIDASGLLVSPGLIDLQINGGFGLDLQSDPGALWDLGGQLPQSGVTGFLPTIISSPPQITLQAMQSLANRPAEYAGAEPIGLHFEGPMLNPHRRGAHLVNYLVEPAPELVTDWTRDNGVALVTIAPELPGAAAVISQLAAAGVTVAAGHSNATEEEIRTAMSAGVTMVTHLFNAMAPLGHRTPNLVGVTLAEHLITGLIVDGVHVHPTVVAAAWKAKGSAEIALVTDAVAAMGRPPGCFEFAGTTITADGTAVRNEDGNLAGSVLTMDKAVRNLVAYANCRPEEALISATTTPADVLGDSMRGRIQPDAIADLVIFDANLDVQITICRGRISYIAEAARSRLSDQVMGAT